MKGKVYLVGAGPGDPGLITVKGLECIKQADVLIYDYLASPVLLNYASKNAEIIYVGKKGGDHTLPQDGINSLIAEKANKGFIVTRLKGGDPFIFGRGAEEAEVLIEEGIPFEIVPGVTSAIAAPGHEDPTKEESNIDWSALAKGIGTIVFLMGVKNLPKITSQLINYGMPSDTPVALVRWGTTPRQFSVTGTLENIGNVVKLRKTMNWFENRPLMGKRIVVTRAREQASDLVKLLSDFGAECLECPTIKVVPPDDWKLLDAAIENISSYDWLVFTSVNGVNYFFERLFSKGKDARALGKLNTAVIGPATERRLFNFGLKSDIVPKNYRAESIIEAFSNEDVNGKKILLPRAKDARPILPVELTKMGAIVDEITSYYTKKVPDSADLLLKRLKENTIDLITFTSSSTVKNFKAILPDNIFETQMKNITVACIGPITADTAKNLGFDVHIVANSFTIPGLCEAILAYYK